MGPFLLFFIDVDIFIVKKIMRFSINISTHEFEAFI